MYYSCWLCTENKWLEDEMTPQLEFGSLLLEKLLICCCFAWGMSYGGLWLAYIRRSSWAPCSMPLRRRSKHSGCWWWQWSLSCLGYLARVLCDQYCVTNREVVHTLAIVPWGRLLSWHSLAYSFCCSVSVSLGSWLFGKSPHLCTTKAWFCCPLRLSRRKSVLFVYWNISFHHQDSSRESGLGFLNLFCLQGSHDASLHVARI